MKNASFLFLCCIIFVVIAPITTHLYKGKNNNNEAGQNINIKVLDITNNSIITMPLEEYVWRVTIKEMPHTFSDEAIKAQAIAARTYASRKLGIQINEHNGADMCTDFNHCTAFLLPDEQKKIYGEKSDEICKKIKELTLETKNQILTYNNEPILAAFHAISSGTTEKSSDVWYSQLPYLVNVSSKLDENVDGYHSSESYTAAELKKVFGDNGDTSINVISRTSGGNVKEIMVFGKKYKGLEIRAKLNLRSANFTVTENDPDVFTFDVLGYGHGVGMSQCGANEYAKTGMTYEEILIKYYPDTTLSNIDEIFASRQK